MINSKFGFAVIKVKERHAILHHSIGALPTEVTAARWLLLSIVLIPALLLAFTGISARLFKLQNFEYHPFRVIVDPEENPFNVKKFVEQCFAF